MLEEGVIYNHAKTSTLAATLYGFFTDYLPRHREAPGCPRLRLADWLPRRALVRLRSAPPPQSPRSTPTDPSPPTPAQLQNLRQEAKAVFARLREQLERTPNP
jgi:hypothetical protein